MTLRAGLLGPDGRDEPGGRRGGIGGVAAIELDRRVAAGADEWSELQDVLLATGGMLPSPMVAARCVQFFEVQYWEAEEARVEALRRQRVFDGLGTRHRCDEGWGLV